ncbi:hypothetical protein [Salisediminibacterium beveridgei]|uniref:Uncharacterized protein n=1 Tax=Salisediminibacterium beveridgei TaxID=632773 RepID=A0A1D7QV24_9BACI|nr:hypothetical protein [Salisediminibacterium beveridgei]AOM82864.1 hypothetical protein BBEV_1501 [Salisediminibacterium beveridgei]
MKAAFAIATAGILMISVWGTFLFMFFSEPDHASWADNQPERYQTEYVREIGNINTYLTDSVSTDGKVEVRNESESSDIVNYRTNTLKPSDYPVVKEGDGIGYGDGVSVDDLLEVPESFDN